MVASQPLAQCPASKGCRRVRDRPGVGRVESRGELAEQDRVVSQQPRLAGEHRHDVTTCELAQHRYQLVTDPVAQVGRVAVRRVLDRVKAKLRAQCVGLGTTQGEYRVPGPRAHGREAICGGAAEQVEQDGLRLIVGRVAGGGTDRHGTEPGGTRTRLEIRACTNAHPVNDDLDAELAGDLVHNTDILVGALAQAVVDMMGDHVAAGHHSEHE